METGRGGGGGRGGWAIFNKNSCTAKTAEKINHARGAMAKQSSAFYYGGPIFVF